MRVEWPRLAWGLSSRSCCFCLRFRSSWAVDVDCVRGALAFLALGCSSCCLMRDVPNGRWLRIAHANGASLFFMLVYVHMIRAFDYSSWTAPNEAVCLLGIALLLL